MKTQIVYQTNLDFEASYQKLVESGIAITDKTEKGMIWLKFKDTKTVFMISPYGKIEVAWKNLGEKKILLKILKNLLVSKEGEKLRIEPIKQIREFSYPPPPNFKLSWCDEETKYHKQPVKRGTLKHSRQLSLGLEAILAEDWTFYRHQEPSRERACWREKIELEGNRLKEFAAEHLRSGYPATYERMKHLKMLKGSIEEELLNEGDSKEGVEAVLNHSSFFGGGPTISEKCLKLLDQRTKAYQTLEADIKLIDLRIEAGNPIHGTCRLCLRK